jgi:hypothetical protein
MSTLITITNKTFGLLAAIITFAITYVKHDWGNFHSRSRSGMRANSRYQGWRFTIALTFFPLVVLSSYLPFIPESPRWLYSNGQKEKARAVLEEFHGPEQAQVLFDDMKSSFDRESEHTSYWDLVNTKENRWRTFLTVTFAIWGTFTGHNFWKYYFTSAYNAAGVNGIIFSFLLSACDF